jgi:hypothetical protein
MTVTSITVTYINLSQESDTIVTQIEEKRNVYRILEGKPEGKKPLGRPRCRWVNNIKIDLR